MKLRNNKVINSTQGRMSGTMGDGSGNITMEQVQDLLKNQLEQFTESMTTIRMNDQQKQDADKAEVAAANEAKFAEMQASHAQVLQQLAQASTQLLLNNVSTPIVQSRTSHIAKAFELSGVGTDKSFELKDHVETEERSGNVEGGVTKICKRVTHFKGNSDMEILLGQGLWSEESMKPFKETMHDTAKQAMTEGHHRITVCTKLYSGIINAFGSNLRSIFVPHDIENFANPVAAFIKIMDQAYANGEVVARDTMINELMQLGFSKWEGDESHSMYIFARMIQLWNKLQRINDKVVSEAVILHLFDLVVKNGFSEVGLGAEMRLQWTKVRETQVDVNSYAEVLRTSVATTDSTTTSGINEEAKLFNPSTIINAFYRGLTGSNKINVELVSSETVAQTPIKFVFGQVVLSNKTSSTSNVKRGNGKSRESGTRNSKDSTKSNSSRDRLGDKPANLTFTSGCFVCGGSNHRKDQHNLGKWLFANDEKTKSVDCNLCKGQGHMRGVCPGVKK